MWKTLACGMAVTLWLAAVLHAQPQQPRPAPPPRSTPPATALPTPLPADLFQGRVREAYRAAGDIPDVLAGLTCYCGCDRSAGHRHLLDCFTDDHGAG